MAEALGTARGIKDEFRRARVLAGVAEAQAEAGKVAEALGTARDIKDESRRAWALAGIAAILAEKGLK